MVLQIDDPAPEFSLEDHNRTKINLADLKGKKVLVYFYPKADTPGCTKQTCLLNDHLGQLNQLDVSVLGISPDKVDKQKKFAEKYGINFSLLSDEDHAVAELYSVWGEKKMYGRTYMGIIRSAFLIDEQGAIIEAWYKVSPKDTVSKALKRIEA
ncbi:MAG: thioredoxin-dependent thiol peroxidase [Gammaproteobacteria bacterium]|nr:MAG: thioredoxin-dependent thiol peroxidase [Gammaproteobacteria bacterium]